MNFTFKKDKRSTGLAGIGEATTVRIKVNKKEVGYITSGGWRSADNLWHIYFAVKHPEKLFEWKRLKYKGQTEQETRDWLKDNFKIITEKYDLYQFED